MGGARIIFAGGGTGGHLFPAIAIAEEIKKRRNDAEILFVGTKNKIEARVVPQKGFRFETIWISGWRRSLHPDSLLFPVKLLVAMIQSYSILKKFRPDIVVGTGGYVCGPIVRMASYMRVPTVIQEQNSYPGVTTRLLASRADRVFVSFSETLKYLKRRDNVRTVGNPTRAELESVSRDKALEKFNLNDDSPVVLVFGGSLGAASINESILDSISVLDTYKAQLIWSAGESMCADIKNKLAGRKGTVIVPFIDDMASALAAADLAVCRAGATTIAELTRTGVPAILVPYPYAAANHQEFNARSLSEKGGALLIKNSDLPRELPAALNELLSAPDALGAMRTKVKGLGRPDAGEIIAQSILELAEGKTK